MHKHERFPGIHSLQHTVSLSDHIRKQVTFIIAGLVYMWMEWINDDSDHQKLGNQPTETVFFAALSITGESRFQPSTNYARLFVFSLAFWSLMIGSSYTANLVSQLLV